ncbi:16657_t:CDS:2 [Cetraspora pellucida]|uniref:16657_t:CDS:1 n=1 Tax=Cetraspora pellucida TaxID=1433469 RepID=A0ACA9KQJ5_9GLOM|nr:16657_t:CDS:2 [Cetraspora pellucida]
MDNQNVYRDTQRKCEKRKNENFYEHETRLAQDHEKKREKRAAETTEEWKRCLASDRNRKRRKKVHKTNELNIINEQLNQNMDQQDELMMGPNAVIDSSCNLGTRDIDQNHRWVDDAKQCYCDTDLANIDHFISQAFSNNQINDANLNSVIPKNLVQLNASTVTKELKRVLKSGGIIEQHESDGLGNDLEIKGKDPFVSLRFANFNFIHFVGEINAANLKQAYLTIQPWLTPFTGLTEDEYNRTIKQIVDKELDDYHSYTNHHIILIKKNVSSYRYWWWFS